jgi:peptidoglycan/LPS O-acetylase OafA/YrhL
VLALFSAATYLAFGNRGSGVRSENRSYIPEIDHLRAFAAVLILVYHGQQLIGAPLGFGKPFDASTPWPQTLNPFATLVIEGHSAVSLFIALSGFILTYGMLDKTLSYGKFALARILRIYPMLIVCLIAAVATGIVDQIQILNSLLPISPLAIVSSPFTAMFWAVKVELQCYVLFPALLWLLRTRGPGSLLSVIILVVSLRFLGALSTGASPRDLSYWTLLGRLDQFVIGMMTAYYVRRVGLYRLPPMCFLAGAVLPLAMLVAFNQAGGWPVEPVWRIVYPTVEACVWMAFSITYLSFGKRVPRVLGAGMATVGTISYSMYLLHFAVINAVVRHQVWLTPTGRPYVDAVATSLLIVFPIVLALAWMTYRLIEKPFMDLRPRYVQQKHRAYSLADDVRGPGNIE